mmetsp:Transcript_16466/g.37933  ORF Transcript_16466/g.37933 Transcript_16466/m.37933 type:complete len:209 (-) Transcript_16466:10-636(-)
MSKWGSLTHPLPHFVSKFSSYRKEFRNFGLTSPNRSCAVCIGTDTIMTFSFSHGGDVSLLHLCTSCISASNDLPSILCSEGEWNLISMSLYATVSMSFACRELRYLLNPTRVIIGPSGKPMTTCPMSQNSLPAMTIGVFFCVSLSQRSGGMSASPFTSLFKMLMGLCVSPLLHTLKLASSVCHFSGLPEPVYPHETSSARCLAALPPP